MINEQEQAIAKIQQTLNHCIQETVNMLEDAIGRKTESCQMKRWRNWSGASTSVLWMNSQTSTLVFLPSAASSSICTFPTFYGKAHS